MPIVQLSLDDLGLDSQAGSRGGEDALRQEAEEMPEEVQPGGGGRTISSLTRGTGDGQEVSSVTGGDGPSPLVVTKKKKGKKKSRAIVE